MSQELPEGTVTILFTDVVGSTELTNRLGDEAARRVLGACDEIVRQQVARHRGREVKGTGDGLMDRRLAHQLTLRSFGEDEVRLMLQVLGKQEPPAALVRVIFDETEGVPYFVEEVFRHLLEEGRLFDADGGWQSDVQLGEIEVPDSVRQVIGRRLEKVSEPTRQLLTQAAAVGRDFTYEFIRALTQSEEESLLDAVEEAERARLIRSREGAAPHFAFWHEQIRQTLLANLSFPRRQRLHLSVARRDHARRTTR